MALLSVSNLRVHFHTRAGVVRAVDGVSFSLEAGQTAGIVGESGCGKSVTCYSLLGLIPMPPGRIEGGSAMFDGLDLLAASESQLRRVRGKRISMIFQDPMTSLNPYLRISTQLIEPLRVHLGMDRKTAFRKAVEALAETGIPEPERRIRMYPHEFSGGMRQRVMIAMALITNPDILIADEPSTALDVTVQKQILDLIKERQKRLGVAVLFITHDLAVVSNVCDRVHVMYAGRFMECASTRELFTEPQHPYTVALQRSVPALQKKGDPLYTIEGLPPDLIRPMPGCPFAPRCEFATDPPCRSEPVPLMAGPGSDHLNACLRFQRGEIQPSGLGQHSAAEPA
ncbi:MAG TPA: ABC transporter ATP-binding protein [Verrucomicrobiales bacterium]|nr:ABC transporter ATP-binding protein [Verrucomicrobiales bacterium]